MIHAGQTIENPLTGERILFRKTSQETNGEAVVIETWVQPNGFVAAGHVHPSQEERFEVLRGSVGFNIGRKKLVAGPGQRITVPAGTAHSSGTRATTRRTSSARSAPRCSSSRCSRRCSRSRPTARRTGRACRTRCGSR